MLGIATAVLLFHVLIVFQVVPYDIVWAGKVNDVNQMLVFETVSIAVNLLLVVVLLLKGQCISNGIPSGALNGFLWFFVILFAVNTIGNLFAKSEFELYVFTPLTLVCSLLCLRIVRP
ncbi:MAG: hypothetical protein K8S54_20420 [Spirochaetia bacterium]|nr:hypothetical protein [Spirochaetia bacterium]